MVYEETFGGENAKLSSESLAVVRAMEDALAANSNNMQDHFRNDFRWMGNYGSGVKNGLAEFRRNWQLPFRAAFSERDYKTSILLA